LQWPSIVWRRARNTYGSWCIMPESISFSWKESQCQVVETNDRLLVKTATVRHLSLISIQFRTAHYQLPSRPLPFWKSSIHMRHDDGQPPSSVYPVQSFLLTFCSIISLYKSF
jgi:hypothetical protein